MKPGQWWLRFGFAIAVAIGVGLVLRFLPMDEDLILQLTAVGFFAPFLIHLIALFRQVGKPPRTSVDWSLIFVVLLCVTVAVAWIPKGTSVGAAGMGMLALGQIVGRWRSKGEAAPDVTSDRRNQDAR